MTRITDDMKTDWFHCGITPMHVGTYETRFAIHEEPETRYWNGKWWQHDEVRSDASDKSLFARGKVGKYEQWRGLKAPYDGETS